MGKREGEGRLRPVSAGKRFCLGRLARIILTNRAGASALQGTSVSGTVGPSHPGTRRTLAAPTHRMNFSLQTVELLHESALVVQRPGPPRPRPAAAGRRAEGPCPQITPQNLPGPL